MQSYLVEKEKKTWCWCPSPTQCVRPRKSSWSASYRNIYFLQFFLCLTQKLGHSPELALLLYIFKISISAIILKKIFIFVIIWKKNWIFTQNLDFWPKSVFLTEIWIFDRNLDIWTKSRFLTEIWIVDQNLDFCPKSGFLSKIWIFVQNLDFCPKSGFLIKIWIFDQNLDFWSKSRFLTEISISLFHQKSQFTTTNKPAVFRRASFWLLHIYEVRYFFLMLTLVTFHLPYSTSKNSQKNFN